MDSDAGIQTLWDLIGKRMAHVNGDGGVVDYAFTTPWHFAVNWDDADCSYPRVVPAEVLVFKGVLLSELLASTEALREAQASWDAFNFVSKASNPEQFMVADRSRVEDLLKKRDLTGAQKAYGKTCSFWWPREEFQRSAQALAAELKRASDQKRVQGLLDEGRVDDAKDYFRAHCTGWWSVPEFQVLVTKAEQRIARKAAEEQRKIERERQRAESRERERRRATVLEYLQNGDFAGADSLMEEFADLFSSSEYASIRQRHHEEQEQRRIAAEHDRLRAKVRRDLEDNRIDVADELYHSSCSEWWPEELYLFERRRAISKHLLVERFCGSSLSWLDSHFAAHLADEVSPDEFARIKTRKVAVRLARIGLPLSEEQVEACARPDQHRLVRARAGSGKTRTLAALAALAIQDESLDPDQVLVLAFNRRAAKEIGNRIRNAAGVEEFRNARTFHGLAWQLADHQGRKLIFDDGNLAPSTRKQSGFMQRLFYSLLNPVFRERLYEFFRRELDELDQLGAGLSGAEYVAFRRSLRGYSLGGENVKSKGEKFIADFLFEHGIEYEYEQVWSWEKSDQVRATPYRPDFSLLQGGRDFVIEHWAIDPGDAEAVVPDWWETTTHEYRELITAKRDFWRVRGVPLIETHAAELFEGREAFEAALYERLESAGLRCEKLSKDELEQRVASAPRTVSRMAQLFLQFVSRSKQMGWDVNDVQRILKEQPDPDARNRAFHELGVTAYAAYERALEAEVALDFDDLLARAVAAVENEGVGAHLHLGKGKFIRLSDLRWILIDEFQDFSELYLRLISGFLKVNPAIRIVAVGDDWQAINGFAGAKLKYFNGFADYFPGAGDALISANRRSGTAIVAAGNKIMSQGGLPAQAFKEVEGEVSIKAVDKVWVADGSEYMEAATFTGRRGQRSVNLTLAKALQACSDFIAGSVYTVGDDQRRWIPPVLLLSRTGHIYGVRLANFEKLLGRVLRTHPALQHLANDFVVGTSVRPGSDVDVSIEAMTVHKSKGKEADTVIVLDASANQFPKVHADNQLFAPFGTSEEDVLAEERRLFYVAVTRAEHRLLLLTDSAHPSPYLSEIEDGLATRPASSPSGGGSRASTEFGRELARVISGVDPVDVIRQNISPEAVGFLDRFVLQGMGVPETGYVQGDLHAELCWPNCEPKLVVLTGRDRDAEHRWRSDGWAVHCA